MPDGPAYCIGMPDGPSGKGDTENGVVGVRVAVGRLLASYSLPRRRLPRGISPARVFPLAVANQGAARAFQLAAGVVSGPSAWARPNSLVISRHLTELPESG